MSALDNFAKIPLSRKLAGAIVLLALGGTIYYFARYQSLAADHGNLVRRHTKLQGQEREFLTKRDSYEADVHRLAKLREDFGQQRRILPPDTQMSTFLEHLNNHAELAGLEIALVQPLDEEASGFYAKIPVELHLKGRYHELAKFFHNVGQLERVINIENISFGLHDDDSDELDEDVGLAIDAEVLATTFRSLDSEDDEEESTEGGG